MWRRHVDHTQKITVTQDLELNDSTSTNQDSDETFMSDSISKGTIKNDQEATPSDCVSDDAVTKLPK